MDQNKKTPQVRFKGYTDTWEQRKLGEVAPLRGGYAFKSDEYKTEGTPIVRISNILSDGSVGAEFAYYDDIEDDENITLGNGDALLAMSGATTGKVSILKCNNIDKYYQNQRVGYFERNEQYNYGFVSTIVRSDLFKEQLTSVLVAGAQPNVSSKEIDSFEFMFPSSIEEQEKIGQYFQNFDNLITLHQRKYNKLLNMKKAMLEKMFPQNGSIYPEIRFKGLTDAWEQRKWSDSVDISTEMVDPKTGIYDELPHVAPGNIESFTGQIYDNVKLVKDEDLISGKFHFYDGDIIYGKINPQLGKYIFARFEGLTSADAYVLNAKNKVVQEYLFTILQTKDFFNYSVSVSKRSGMPKINRDELNAYSFLAPSKEEQKQIGELFLSLDNLITLHQRKLEKLKNIKKVCLEKMFV